MTQVKNVKPAFKIKIEDLMSVKEQVNVQYRAGKKNIIYVSPTN